MIYKNLRKNFKNPKYSQLTRIFVVFASIGGTRTNNARVSATFAKNGGIPKKIALKVLKKLNPKIRPEKRRQK